MNLWVPKRNGSLGAQKERFYTADVWTSCFLIKSDKNCPIYCIIYEIGVKKVDQKI